MSTVIAEPKLGQYSTDELIDRMQNSRGAKTEFLAIEENKEKARGLAQKLALGEAAFFADKKIGPFYSIPQLELAQSKQGAGAETLKYISELISNQVERIVLFTDGVLRLKFDDSDNPSIGGPLKLESYEDPSPIGFTDGGNNFLLKTSDDLNIKFGPNKEIQAQESDRYQNARLPYYEANFGDSGELILAKHYSKVIPHGGNDSENDFSTSGFRIGTFMSSHLIRRTYQNCDDILRDFTLETGIKGDTATKPNEAKLLTNCKPITEFDIKTSDSELVAKPQGE